MNEKVITEYLKSLTDILDTQGTTIEQIVNQIEELRTYSQQISNLPILAKYGLNYINKQQLDYEIELFDYNLHKKKNKDLNIDNMKIIVSLTSFPRRMYELKYTLFSLVKQSIHPDFIILWLAEDEFPRHEDDIAPSLYSLIQKWNIKISWVPNLKSYKKLIPAISKYPNDIIITADDDLYYPDNWLEILINEYCDFPNIIAHRSHYISFDKTGTLCPYGEWGIPENGSISFRNFGTTGGGILYFPRCFYKDILDEEKFMSLCPTADDIWFWAMATLAGQMIKIPKQPVNSLIYVNPEREFISDSSERLGGINVWDGGNDGQLAMVIKEYPEILDILHSE